MLKIRLKTRSGNQYETRITGDSFQAACLLLSQALASSPLIVCEHPLSGEEFAVNMLEVESVELVGKALEIVR